MPDATPACLLPVEVLEEALATLFHRLQADPGADALLGLVDQLEEAYRRSLAPQEPRTIG